MQSITQQAAEPDQNGNQALDLLEAARLVGRLLESQSQALHKGDSQKLIAITHQIDRCLPRISQSLGRLDKPWRGRVRRQLTQLQERIDRNRRQWQRHIVSWRASRARLGDSRRLTRNLKAQLEQGRRSLYHRSA